eukprot:TRINITY_DN3399_c0_g1_i5.p1 TRINITY_DN3399_c0_g1~~TRINITY_DN3399_c0_g1_i5.p1  ORF type:complete len:159 (-),score=41.37 TRINITY_DN3399_c0_g1_i5:73-549(-)
MLDPTAKKGSCAESSFDLEEKKFQKNRSKNQNDWIGCLALDQAQDWLVCGGGNKQLTVWHLPSLFVISSIPTTSPSLSVALDEDLIIAVGQEKDISYFRRNGNLQTKFSSSSSSLFSVVVQNYDATSSNSKVLVASGSSPYIDVISNSSQKSFSCCTY